MYENPKEVSKGERKVQIYDVLSFKMGRDKRQFYYSVKQLYEEFNMDFGDILHMRPTLGPGDRKFNWQMHVQTLSDEFKFYFRQHKWKIKVPFEENEES